MRQELILNECAKGICSFCHVEEATLRCKCCGGKVCHECEAGLYPDHAMDPRDDPGIVGDEQYRG